MSFDPDGPIVIPINTLRNITCSSTDGAILSWYIILRHSTVFGASSYQANVERFGITGIFMIPSLQLIVNTSKTSIVGLRCVGIVPDSMTNKMRGNVIAADINVTIYGKFN